MKKTKYLLVSLLCLMTVICFAGCGKNKKAISPDEFCTKMEKKGFITTDSTSQYATSKEITESYIAFSKGYEYQIEFVVLDSADAATRMFNQNKSIFESEKNGANSNTSVELANYSKFTLLVNGKYKVVSRIDNTLIYINADSKYKDDITSILDELGY